MNAVLGKPVEIGSIALELKKLWEEDEAATNASLMNLVVYSEKANSLVENSEAVVALTREHACRAILVEMARKAPVSEVEAWVTAHCHLAHGRKTVCCEQLSFLLKGKALGRMRNTLFANLNSDLPLVFWWQGELSDLFQERLYQLVDRLIFDSSEWAEVKAGYERLQRAVEDSHCRMGVQDLAWTRTYHFRLGVAGLFDDSIAQKMLTRVTQVRVTGQSAHWTSSWMVVAWLAVQAGWSLQSFEGDDFTFVRSDGGKVVVSCFHDDSGPPLQLVELSDGEALVSVSRRADDAYLNLLLDSPGHIVRQITPSDQDEQVALVAEQLSRGGKNSLFRKVWPMFTQMLNA